MAKFSMKATLACALITVLLISPSSSLRIPAAPLVLSYHKGPLLAGEEPIKLYLTFYGGFTTAERSALKSFLASLSPSPERRSLRTSLAPFTDVPSVSKWWSLTQAYRDSQGIEVSQTVEIKGEANDDYSLGKHLNASAIAKLVKSSMTSLSSHGERSSIHLVFTSQDVYVDGFCAHACGGHNYIVDHHHHHHHSAMDASSSHHDDDTMGGSMVPYAWIGNPNLQCPGFCSWPFAKTEYGPPMEPLIAPNGAATDGMIITMAKVLAGTVTNPFGNAYFQGDSSFSLEAGGACTGKFGHGAYPGFPGELMLNPSSGASYNMEGRDGMKFLVPWIWNPLTLSCAGQP